MTSDRHADIENAIAISAAVHTHARYSEFYDTIGPKVGGFTGIYDIIAAMAAAVTAFEDRHGGTPGAWDEMPTGRDWTEFVDEFADLFITRCIAWGGPVNITDTIKHLENNPK